MFEIPSTTLQFVSTAFPNGRLRGGNFGVSFLYIWPRQGFYVEFFLIDAFSQFKDIQLAALLQHFKGPKNHEF